LLPRPDKAEKATTARWMVHSLSWGTLSTISTRIGDDTSPVPFGNIYSFVDGPCHEATGIPYFYGTYLDQSFTDTLVNPIVSLSLSEASLSSVCANRDGLDACTLGTKYGDPESPVCARVTVTGTFEVLGEGSPEYIYAQQSIFHRHTTMQGWPSNHHWVIGKINVQDVWLIDFFGGAAIISAEEYFAANPDNEQQDE
jgi:Pyridoxamine 5'-phosphate oxidase